MKRKELFEFEDYPALPSWIRSSLTRLIIVLHRLQGSAAILANLIRDVRSKSNFSQVYDFGSGSGGPMPEVARALDEDQIEIRLSDLHPDAKQVQAIQALNIENLDYRSESVDATKAELPGDSLRTMINSFHHCDPQMATGILKDAVSKRQPILIYEMGENKIPFLLWVLLLPLSFVIMILMTWVITPMSKPRIEQVLFTYLIPIIPLIFAWDGQASVMRMYTFSDLKELLKGVPSENYQWEMDQAKNAKGKVQGYYLMGYPT
jgi:hypothetical protein